MQKKYFVSLTTGFFLLSILCTSLFAQSDTSFIPRLARASEVQGKAFFQGSNMFDWEELTINTPVRPGDRIATDTGTFLELELDDGNYFRFAEVSKLDIVAMDMDEQAGSISTRLRLLSGDYYGQVLTGSRYGAEFLVEFSTGQIKVQDAAVFRVTVFDDQTTQIRVMEGEVLVSSVSGTIPVRLKQSLVIDPYGNADRVTSFEWWRKDDFDLWNESRMDYVGQGGNGPVMENSFRSGWGELNRNGRWVYVEEYGDVWVPTVSVGWVPYRYGYWNYIAPWGWTWISYERWGWIPYHYGSWTWTIDFGWAWVPGSYWSPGWVSWYYGSGYVGWVACNPWDYGYRSFYRNYCGWFPYHCRHYHHGHHYHSNHQYHQNPHHYGKKGIKGHRNVYQGDPGDYGRESYWQRHIQNYGESVPINATHKMGIDPGTTIRASQFFNRDTISESTVMVTTNVPMKQRNWVTQLPDLNTVAAKTDVSQTTLKRIKQDLSPGSPADAPEIITREANTMPGETMGKRVNPSTSGTRIGATSTRQRIENGVSTQRVEPSLNNRGQTNSKAAPPVTTNRSDQTRYIDWYRSTRSRSQQQVPRAKSNESKTTRSTRTSETSSQSQYKTNEIRKYSNYRSTKSPPASSTYRIPPKQTGIRGMLDSFRNRQPNSYSRSTPNTTSRSGTGISSKQKSSSNSSSSSKSSSGTKSQSKSSSSSKSQSKSKKK